MKNIVAPRPLILLLFVSYRGQTMCCVLRPYNICSDRIEPYGNWMTKIDHLIFHFRILLDGGGGCKGRCFGRADRKHPTCFSSAWPALDTLSPLTHTQTLRWTRTGGVESGGVGGWFWGLSIYALDKELLLLCYQSLPSSISSLLPHLSRQEKKLSIKI